MVTVPRETTVKSMLAEINRLRQMTVPELQRAWERLYGEPTRSQNKTFLWKRLAWRLQELQYGGISDRAKIKIDELAPESALRSRTSVGADVTTDGPNSSHAVLKTGRDAGPRVARDPGLPSPGTVLTRQYHGREFRLLVLDDGFELDGVHYRSLTEAARAITGSKWNGRLFWGLTQRKRKS